MFCFPLRRKGRRLDPPESMDRGIFLEESLGAARPQQPELGEFSNCRHWWRQDGTLGSRESRRDTGIPGEAGHRPDCAQGDGKEPGSRWNAGAQREKLENVPRGIQALRKGLGDEPGVPHLAWNGNVPREGREQPQPLLQAGAEDEEGESSDSSQDPEPLAAAGTPGVEPREQIWETLRQLGENMEPWEGKTTAALAARLAQRIVETPTPSYPSDPGMRSVHREPGSGASPDLGASAGYGKIFVGMLRASGKSESEEEDEEEEVEEEEEEEVEEEEEEEDNEDLEHSDWEQEEDPAFFSMFVFQSAHSRALQEEFPEVWAEFPLDCGRLAEEVLLDGDPVPFQRQPQNSPEKERRMAALLWEYLREGIVVQGSSDCNNPLILWQKSRGRGWRLSLDCRALNAATPVGPPERPDRAAILASIHPRSRFFSVLDLSDACLAIPLDEGSWPRFAFTFQGRQFLFTRLPPTFHGTSSILHRRVAAVLARLQPQPGAHPGVFHYYDDILITGKSWRQAESRTRRMLELIQSSGFKVNPNKAQLMQRQVNYLGVTLGAEGRSIPEETVRELRQECEARGPWDRRRLRSILKKFESRQEFISDFWELALPLQRLAEPRRQDREQEWEWQREQRQQLRRLLEALEDAPVLCFPVRSRPFLIRLWVHAETAGAALLQEKAGMALPVAHGSHRLRGRDLSPWDAWRQAAVRAVRDFQIFTGTAPIVIQDLKGNFLLRGEEFVTSSSSCSSSDGSLPPEPWTLLASIHVPKPQESQRNVILPAPPLGQLPTDIPRANVWFLAVEKGLWPCSSVGFGAANLEERSMSGVSGRGSEEDAEMEALREILQQHRSRFPLFLYCGRPGLAARLERLLERGCNSGGNARPVILRWLCDFPGMLHVRDVGRAGSAEPAERERLEELSKGAMVLGCVTRSSWIIWRLSQPERQEIVARCHQSQHEGVEQTRERVNEVDCWSDKEDVTRWVRSCPTCKESDPDPDPQRKEGPWSCLRISVSGALPRTAEGFRALLLVQDELSGWLDAFPLRQRSQPEVSRLLLREVFGRLGKVRSVLPAPAPAWLRHSLQEVPLQRFWSRLELREPPAAAACVCRAAQGAGQGWAAALPLILAAVRSQWAEPERLRPMLCVPGLPLELCWDEGPGPEPPCPGRELSRLRGMRLLPGYREQVETAICTEPGERVKVGIHQVRDMGIPDPGSEYARPSIQVRRIQNWLLPGHELGGAGSGIGIRRALAPP